MAPIDGNHCIAEAIISKGRQCTLEGYVHGGKSVVYGVVDSIREGRLRSSFARYQYPSQLPAHVQDRVTEAAAALMAQIGYDTAPFNMEFYWSPANDQIRLLEVNARISKSLEPRCWRSMCPAISRLPFWRRDCPVSDRMTRSRA